MLMESETTAEIPLGTLSEAGRALASRPSARRGVRFALQAERLDLSSR